MKLDLPEERTFTSSALLWRRAAAFAIDFFILDFFVLASFNSLLEKNIPADYNFSKMYDFLKSNPDVMRNIIMILAFSSVIAGLYFLLLESRMQQSIGKKFMNIYIVSTKDNASTPTFWQNILRNLIFIPIFPFILLFIIDPIFMLFNKNSQRLSDILSNTKVVQKYNI